jgi:hypothetical protein
MINCGYCYCLLFYQRAHLNGQNRVSELEERVSGLEAELEEFRVCLSSCCPKRFFSAFGALSQFLSIHHTAVGHVYSQLTLVR